MMNPLDAAVKKIRIVHLAMLVSLLIYPFVAEKTVRQGFVGEVAIGSGRVDGADPFQVAIALIACSMVPATMLLRSRMLPQAEDTLRREPDNVAAVQRWTAANIVSFALTEAVGLFGLVVRVMGAPLYRATFFYAGAVLLMLIYYPRRP